MPSVESYELTDYDLTSTEPLCMYRPDRLEFTRENAEELYRLAREGYEEVGRGAVVFELDVDLG